MHSAPQVRDRYRARQERDRAMSTVTNVADDLAWREDEIGSDDEDDAASFGGFRPPSEDGAGSDAGEAPVAKRWSAEAAGTTSQSVGQVRGGNPGVATDWLPQCSQKWLAHIAVTCAEAKWHTPPQCNSCVRRANRPYPCALCHTCEPWPTRPCRYICWRVPSTAPW